MHNKPKLRPPETPRPFSPDPRVFRMKVVASLVFMVMVIAAVAVVAILPDQLAKTSGHEGRPADGAAAQVVGQPSDNTIKGQPEEDGRAEAEVLLQQALSRQAALEAEGVKVWGSRPLVTSYPQALAKLAEADSHFKADRYDLSAKAYKETIGMLEQLASSRPERIRTGVQSGLDALDRFDDKTAIREFETVLALDPANAQANQGLERARKLPRVRELVEKGQMAEKEGELEHAREIYAEAVALDEENKHTRAQLERVEQLIRTRQFERAVAEAESALERGDFSATREGLQRARQLRPEADEVRDIAGRLNSRSRQAELERIQSQASAYEQKENWHEARRAYERALKIDANAAFALKGKTRTKKLDDLNRAIARYLANPNDLQKPETLAMARKTWSTASTQGAGRRMRKKNDELGRLIDAYGKPVSVVLRSDDQTEVTLYRVARLGRFREHKLQLRPGLYTAHGIRSGFRDVKVKFQVPITGVQTTVSVICRETI